MGLSNNNKLDSLFFCQITLDSLNCKKWDILKRT